jgi:mannose-6-phosphate isomerase-like protein (cupin superfamily)
VGLFLAVIVFLTCTQRMAANEPMEVIHLEEQPWLEAEDRAIAREIASPRNSRAEQLSIADIIIPAGVKVRPHYHRENEEVYFVSSGSGLMHVDGREQRIGSGDAVVIKPGERHFVHNDSTDELRLIVTCTPPWTPECLCFDDETSAGA